MAEVAEYYKVVEYYKVAYHMKVVKTNKADYYHHHM